MKVVQFLNGFIDEKLLNLNTAMPCRVISYDESKRRASVQPLFMVKEVGRAPEALPPIQDVPVLKQRFKLGAGEPQEYVPVYEPGDVVLVAFAQRAIDDVLGGQMAYPGTRRHDLTDAVILGVIA